MDTNIKLVLLGETSTGKTSIVYRLLNKQFQETSESTIGAGFSVLKYDDIKFQIWDTAGQERYSPLLPMYYRDANVIMLVYDTTNLSSIDKIDNHLYNIINIVNSCHKIIIVGNKIDLVTDDKLEWCSELVKQNVKKHPEIQHKIEYITISAKNGTRFLELESKLIETGKDILDERDFLKYVDQKIVNLDSSNKENKFCSC